MDEAIAARVRRADELGSDQRGGQPARAARRPGADRRVPRVHVHVRARAGLLPPEPGAGQQSRAALECRQPPRLTRGSGTPPRPSRAQALRALQLERLQATVDRVLRAQPLGAERLRAGGDHCRPARSARSTTSSGFRSRPSATCATPTRSACWRCRAPSSSVSTPRAARTASRPSSPTRAADLETWTELMARCMAMAGVRPGMTIHNANGYGLFTGGLGFHQGGERLGATVVPVSGGRTARQAMLLTDLGSEVLVATPSYALVIAQALRDERRRSGDPAARARAVRRRAVERADAGARSSARSASARSTSTACRRCAARASRPSA